MHDHENFEMFSVLNKNHGLRMFGNKVVMFIIALNIDHIGWQFRLLVKSAASQLVYENK